MNKLRKSILMFIFVLSSVLFIGKVNAVYSDAQVGNYEQELAKFPSGYKAKIQALHQIYPNAVFVVEDRFFDWGKYTEVEVSWNDMLSAEMKGTKSLIEASAPAEYRTGTCAQYRNDGSCSWYIATQAGVEYYMNPYNFLDEKHVFMFESQYYRDYHIEQGIEKILSSTAYANTICPGSNKTYAQVILEAGVKYNVSPYMLAARLRQENGAGTSSLVTGNYPGYEGYYDHFNISASGSTNTEIVVNGLNRAKEKGWTSPYLAIIGGAEFIYKEYVGINDTYNVKGQMTNYLQKWDPYGYIYAGHQYMQNIRAPYYEAESTYNSYASFENYKNFNYIFYIPIFKDAPNLVAPKTYSLGELNGDGEIDSSDLLRLRQHLIGSNKLTGDALTAADINKDGSVDSSDLLRLRQHLIGTNKIS